MTEERLDRVLERLFQEALGLSREAEDAFWKAFRSQCRRDELAWITFRDVMIRQTLQVQHAVRWSARSRYSLPGVPARHWNEANVYEDA